MPSASSQKQIPLRHCVISSLMHSKTQSGIMYHDEPIFQTHHHQRPQSLPPMEVATTLWPQQTSNYWFPNWRELFHGFNVVQGGQHGPAAAVSSFNQNQIVTCTRQDSRSSLSPSSCTQYLHLGTNDLTRSSHHGAQLARQQQISTPLPSLDTHTPYSCLDDVTHLPHRGGEEAHTVAQLPNLVDQTQKGDDHIACPPSSQAPGSLLKYIIKSPFWLPQGWVTEMRMRSTGTTTDKFYKHLASGRRFRSRNEVLHFIRTGKGRTRKKNRRKTSLALAAANISLMNNFAHKKHTAFSASKLLSRSLPSSSSENRHPIHVGNPMLTEPSTELIPNGETGPPSKQHICFSANSGIHGPESLQVRMKQPTQEKTQKLAVKKKLKTLPLKAGEDKQTSKLWQWSKRSGTETQVSEMAELRNENDLRSNYTASQKSAQLGMEIQAAHRTVVQMSKEMQATAEKLSREIREAQKNVKLCHDLKLPAVPTEMNVASIKKADAGKSCRDTQNTPGPCVMTSGAVQVSHWLHIAANNQANWPNSAVGFASHAIQKSDNIKDFLKQEDPRLNVSSQATNFALHALNQERSFANDRMSHAIQPAIWPAITSQQATQMASGSHAAKRQVDTSNHATQPVETALAATVNGTQAARLHAAAPIHVTEATGIDVIRPALWPGVLALNVVQPTQIAAIAQVSNAKAAEKCGPVDSHLPQHAEFAYFHLNNRAQAPQRHDADKGNHHIKQPAQINCIGTADAGQVAEMQMAAMGPLLPATEKPISSIGHENAPLHNPAIANALGNAVPPHADGGPSDQLHAARVSTSFGAGTNEEVGRRKYQDRKARRLRRKKFEAVLNPKLDLSRLNPALTARQRAKVVQRMKNRHARELLATLGLHLCRKAIRRKPRL